MHLRLSDVARSAAASLGVAGFTDSLGLGSPRHVVVLLVDGLGEAQRERHLESAPVLASGRAHDMHCSVPSTTPVGLATFGTGLEPGEHGFVGASFMVPETGRVLAPLHWGDDPHPVAVQPEVTVFETMSRSGVQVASVGPEEYRNSGLTRAVLRGGDYRAAESARARAHQVHESIDGTQRSFTYVYWPHLDRIGHEFGPDSEQWLAGLRQVDLLLEDLLATVPPDTRLVVTADHGMVATTDARRIVIEEDPRLRRDVHVVSGEPRARHLYCTPGSAVDVAARWNDALGELACARTRTEFVATCLIGPCDPVLADRIGDVVVLASAPDVALASHVDPRVSQLIGQHGSTTDEELRIPAIVFTC